MTDRERAIQYRRQLLQIIDRIERDYSLGKYASEEKPAPPTSSVTAGANVCLMFDKASEKV